MKKRLNAITFKGNPLTLLGDEVKPGMKAPEFKTVANDFSTVEFSKYKGKTLIIASVPSLDTPVCDKEAKKFNDEALGLSKDIQILIISADLPFAQARWCGTNGIDRIETLSDFRDLEFGSKYGVLIDELRLLARAIFVVDEKGTIQYYELVKEIGEEPNYAAALNAARELVGA